jgi:hypothetical protein
MDLSQKNKEILDIEFINRNGWHNTSRPSSQVPI